MPATPITSAEPLYLPEPDRAGEIRLCNWLAACHNWALACWAEANINATAVAAVILTNRAFMIAGWLISLQI